jgi:kumamolisin
MTDPTVEIPGSERRLGPQDLLKIGAKETSESGDSSTDTQVTVLLRSDPLAVKPTSSPGRQALREARRPSQLDVEAVVNFAISNNLTVVDRDRPPRMVVLSGKISDIAQAFGTKVTTWSEPWPRSSELIQQLSKQQGQLPAQQPTRPFRFRPDQRLTVPAELGGVVQGVFGIDNRKETRMQMHAVPIPIPRPGPEITNGSQPSSYTVPELAAQYGLPNAENNGDGQTIAILSLGGALNREELDRYCVGLEIPVPEVTEVLVDREPPQLRAVVEEDIEVALDIQVIAALVPRAHIVLYHANNSSEGFINGLARAIYNESLPASIISICWGAYEESWTLQAMWAIEDLLKDASALAITVCCASGDLRSSDGALDGQPHVDFPASSPHVLSCGGTTLLPTQEAQEQDLLAEVVWDDPEAGCGSGGGYSKVFDKPAWQKERPESELKDSMKKRAVPDVSGVANPLNGHVIQDQLVGGTSAVAPFWAGLVARINQKLPKPVGYLNPLLYKVRDEAFRDITDGTNGAWMAKLGWDACTGLGRPRGEALLQELGRLLGLSTGPRA